MEWDAFSGHYYPALKICESDEIPIGVNAYNVYKRIRDVDPGNLPLVLTNSVIEVPVFAESTDAAAIKFGAAVAATADSILGKLVGSNDDGNIVALSTNYHLAIGQCVAIETDVPMEGFLQYFLEQNDTQLWQQIKQTMNAPSAGISVSTGQYDIAQYPYYATTKPIRGWAEGIQMLTDGFFRAKKQVTGISIDNYDFGTTPALYTSSDDQYQQITSYKTMGPVTINDSNPDTITVASDYRGAALRVIFKDQLALDDPGVTVYIANSAGTGWDTVDSSNVHVDLYNNAVTVYFTSAITAKRIKFTANLLIDRTPGIATNADWAKCIGLARIKLTK